MTLIVGIDPGKGGGIAFYQNNQWSVMDCPTVRIKSGKSEKDVPDPASMAFVLQQQVPDPVSAYAYIEQVHAMPKQGVTSMFSFGVSYGMWLGVLGSLGISYVLVPPQKWKAFFNLRGQPKDASRAAALQRFPYLAESLALKKHDGRADALLIGEYGRRSLFGSP